jgi:endonuclease YncB( thermonuclease family)
MSLSTAPKEKKMKTLMLLCSLITIIPAADLKGKVVGVKSGSEIEILQGGNVFAVRIQGIDCPARSFAAGKAARHFLADNAFMNDVQVEITGTGSDGTFIGKVSLPNSTNLGAELVKGGLAWWDKQNSPEETGLARLEKEARDAYLGIWAGASEEDEDEDFGKEVLAKRDLAGKDKTAMLTAGN